jgi:endonuclease YncB( thermonuclease family)
MGLCCSGLSLQMVPENKINDLPRYNYKGRRLAVKVCEIYDGDTCSIVFRAGSKLKKFRVRCYGYDSPEMKPPRAQENRDEEIRKAKLAKARFAELTQSTSYMIAECMEFDKYGRLLVRFYQPHYFGHPKSVNDIMIEEGHGYKYFGGTKQVSI